MWRYRVNRSIASVLWAQQRILGRSSRDTGTICEALSIEPSPIHRRPFSGSGESFLIGSSGRRCGTLLHRSSLFKGEFWGRRDVSPGCRQYYTDSQGLQHFRRRGLNSNNWSPRQIILIVLATGGLCGSVYFSNRETIPYTFRRHFVLIPPDIEGRLVESQFQALKQELKPFILPAFHPDTIRVRRIAKDIIEAVVKGTQLENSHTIEVEHSDQMHAFKEDGPGVSMWQHDASDSIATQWGDREENFDDQWMNKSRKKGLKSKAQPFVDHLKNTKWEVLVVNQDIVNAFCLPGGKIVVYTGLLKRFPSDKEIATVLGHEIGHVVARHAAERMTRHIFLTLVQLFFLAFLYAPDLLQSMSTLFLELPFSRSQELEADHIGLLLMAAAGYDPQTAPYVYEKLGEITKSSELLQYVTTHPSGKKRGERLRKTGTMEEAVRIYQDRSQGAEAEGFLRAL